MSHPTVRVAIVRLKVCDPLSNWSVLGLARSGVGRVCANERSFEVMLRVRY